MTVMDGDGGIPQGTIRASAQGQTPPAAQNAFQGNVTAGGMAAGVPQSALLDYNSDDSSASASSTGTTTRIASKKILKNFSMNGSTLQSTPILALTSRNDTFVPKRLDLLEPVKVGRKVNAKVGPEPGNGVFDSKVLSRNHAEIWYEAGKVWIRDVKSSNGTFLNGNRLSEEGQQSAPFELNTGDIIEFGIDIMQDDGSAILYHKVSCQVSIMDSAGVVRPPPVSKDGDARLSLDKRMGPIAVADEIQNAKETRAELETLKSHIDQLEKTLFRNSPARSMTGQIPPSVLTELETSKAATVAAESVAEMLRRQLKDAADEAKMWRAKWEADRSEADKWKSEALEHESRVESAASDRMKKETEMEGWKNRAEVAEKEIEVLKKREAAAIRTAAAATSAQREHLDSLEGEVERLKKEADLLRADAASAQSKVETSEKELKVVRQECVSLQHRVTDVELAKVELEREHERAISASSGVAASTVRQLEVKLSSVEERAAIAESAAQLLSSKLAIAEKKAHEGQSRIDLLEAELRDARSQASSLEARLIAAVSASSKFTVAENKKFEDAGLRKREGADQDDVLAKSIDGDTVQGHRGAVNAVAATGARADDSNRDSVRAIFLGFLGVAVVGAYAVLGGMTGAKASNVPPTSDTFTY